LHAFLLPYINKQNHIIMFNLRSYLKFLSRNRLYSLVIVSGFAVSLMFVFLLSVYVKQELSVDGFHENKDRIYLIVRDEGNSSLISAFSNPVADVVKDKCPEVEAYTRIVTQEVEIEMSNREMLKANTLYADSAFFRIFSFPLIEGDAAGVIAVKQSAVISESYAAKVFPGENPMGKSLRIYEIDVTINGIMKDFPQNTMFQGVDLVLNYRMTEPYWGNDILGNWSNSSFGIFFLARPGSDLPAKAPMLLEDFMKGYWIYTMGFSKDLSFVRLQDIYFGGVRTSFARLKTNDASVVSTYLGIVILILIVAILNYVNLSTSQAMKRGKESAIRKLLGSSRQAVFMQYIIESVFMTLASLLLGIFLAFWAEPFFNDVLNTNLHLSKQFTLGFILVVLCATVIVGVISGLFPAWAVSRFEPLEVVKGSYSFKVKTVYSKVLITIQYVVAIVLLIYSSFIVLQNDYLMKFDLGFDKDNLFVMSNRLDKNQLPGFRDKLMSISGVEKVSFTAGTPLDGGNNQSLQYNGEPVSFQTFYVDSAFFDVFGIRITESFGLASTAANNADELVVLLNRKAYDVMQPDETTHMVTYNDSMHMFVSGIISNVHFRSLHQEVGPLYVVVNNDLKYWIWNIVVKMAPGTDQFHTADLIKAAYTDYNGGKTFDATFADEMIQDKYTAEARNMKIILAFTILTMTIMMMGILSMALYYVRQREKEIAIRKIHGSTEVEILTMLNRGFIRIIALAFVIAVPVAYYFSMKFLQGFAYKISLNVWVFLFAGAFAVLLSVVFVSMQSWRTVTSNPVKMLKSE
jgi:putative ABC transport system permease protein